MTRVQQLKSYLAFQDFSITPRRIKMTGGDDGDTMWETSPSTDKDCRYHGYRIQNTATDGGYYFRVWNMLTGREIACENRYNLAELKAWINQHLEDISIEVAQAMALAEKEERERKAKTLANKERYCGVSSTTYYKVRSIIRMGNPNEDTTELLTKFVLRQNGLYGNLSEQAGTIRTLHDLGVLKLTEIKKIVKWLETK